MKSRTRQNGEAWLARSAIGEARSATYFGSMENDDKLSRIKPVSASDYAIWPGWLLLMSDAGIEAAPVLKRAQLPGDLFARQNVRLDPESFYRLWTAIEAEGQLVDSKLPVALQIAKVMSSDWFDPELFAALCSANMKAALGRIAKYGRLIAPMTTNISHESGLTTVTLEFLDQTKPPPSVFLAFKLMFFVQLARLATRHEIRPISASWPSVPTQQSELASYQVYFGVPVTPSQITTLVFRTEDVERPFLTENHKMWSFFEPSLRQRLADLDHSTSMRERVKSALLEALPAGEVSMQAICHRLGVSTRTLQRRLQTEGTTFQQTLDGLRDSLAHHYLRNTAMTGSEISFLLGFEDSNSFSRAFQSWTGRTPQTVRAELMTDRRNVDTPSTH